MRERSVWEARGAVEVTIIGWRPEALIIELLVFSQDLRRNENAAKGSV